MKDPVISVKDLLATCVKKANVFLVLAVVFAIALGGFKYVSDLEAQKKVAAAQETQLEDRELTADELEEVNEYVRVALIRDEIAKYIENSVYMNCNPYALDYVELEFDIQAATSIEQIDAVVAIKNYVWGGLPEDMYAMDNSLDVEFYREVITCEAIEFNSNLNSGIIKIKLHATSKEQAETYGEMVANAIEEHVVDLKSKGVEFEITKLYQLVSSEMNAMLTNTQNEYKDILNEYKDNVKNLQEGLSASQLKAAYALLQIEEKVESPVIVVEPVNFDVIFVVIGAIAGVALGVVIVAVKYIFTNTIKTVLDTHNMFGVRSLGLLTCKKLSVWDKIANKIFYSKHVFEAEKETKTIVAQIKAYCEKNEVTEIALAVSANEKELKELEAVVASLKSAGITCKVIDVEDLDAFDKVKNVVMLEMIGVTNFENVENELLFYKSQEINVLGYITVI